MNFGSRATLALLATALSACAPPSRDVARARSEQPGVTGSIDGIHYEAAGSGPAVVLIHGGGLDSRMWDAQFASLARRYGVIRYDVRGLLAAAAVPGAGATPEEPERFRRIGRLADEGRTLEAVEEWLERTHMAAAIRTIARDNHHSWGPPPVPVTSLSPPAAERLHEIRVQTSVVVGDRDDRSVQRLASLVAERIPGARLEVLAGVGHMLNLEAPEAFERWLAGRLDAR